MGKLSIIIPYYQEPYLEKTIASLKENVVGEIEILPEEGSMGMRAAINEGLKKATGNFIMKIDAHCVVCKGFDEITKDCKENWLMVPRRYALNEEKWTKDESRSPRDYHYLKFPRASDPSYGYSFQVAVWYKKGKPEIDDIMTFQGSCWVANRKYFTEHVGFLDDRVETYGSFSQEQQEIGLKYWLGGGEVKVNKKFWYSHLQKRPSHYQSRQFSREHKKPRQLIENNEWITKHWMNNEEPGMIHTFSWLIEKFWPIPTWEYNWKEIWSKYGNKTKSL